MTQRARRDPLPRLRRRALAGATGYQFKHPGEWFSELYAGYKSGKLSRQHPARVFLEQLSP